MSKSRNYQNWLIERLKNHEEALAYLNSALEESLKGDSESLYLLLVALRNIAEAHSRTKKSH